MRVFTVCEAFTMTPRSLFLPTFAVLALAALPALAQYPTQNVQPATQLPPPPRQLAPTTAPVETPAPTSTAPAGAVALPTVPPPNCVVPEYPGSNASNAKIITFNSDYKTYGDCIKKYVDQNRAWVNAVVEINNKAVEEYNRYTTDLKKRLDAAKD